MSEQPLEEKSFSLRELLAQRPKPAVEKAALEVTEEAAAEEEKPREKKRSFLVWCSIPLTFFMILTVIIYGWSDIFSYCNTYKRPDFKKKNFSEMKINTSQKEVLEFVGYPILIQIGSHPPFMIDLILEPAPPTLFGVSRKLKPYFPLGSGFLSINFSPTISGEYVVKTSIHLPSGVLLMAGTKLEDVLPIIKDEYIYYTNSILSLNTENNNDLRNMFLNINEKWFYSCPSRFNEMHWDIYYLVFKDGFVSKNAVIKVKAFFIDDLIDFKGNFTQAWDRWMLSLP
jgi:hypothetical protein